MSWTRQAVERERGLRVLRQVLERGKRERQGGYLGYCGDGQWAFVSTTIGPVKPEELNALFAAAGIEPEQIVTRGPCSTCAHARETPAGRFVERGYDEPCVRCLRPRHDLWEPRQ